MAEPNIFIFLVHILTSVIILAFLIAGYKIIKKFKGGLFSKFNIFIMIGATPAIIYHFTEVLSFSGIILIPEDSILHVIIEHSILLFVFLMIFIGIISSYRDYMKIKTLSTKKK